MLYRFRKIVVLGSKPGEKLVRRSGLRIGIGSLLSHIDRPLVPPLAHHPRNAEKRGGAALRLDLDRDVLEDSQTQVDFDAVHRALERLRQLSERQAEVVTLRVFAGLSMEQTATVLGVSKRTAEGDWTVARAWLRRELSGSEPGT